MLINAVNKINVNSNTNYGILIIGGGPEKTNYEKMLKELNINNIFLIDFLKKDELLSYYDMCDAFIMPTREDIWGLVVNEALSRGLPVLSSDKCLSATELINNNNGKIFKSNNSTELAKAITDFNKKNNVEIKKMSMAALLSIKKYTIERMTEDHKNIIEEIMKRG